MKPMRLSSEPWKRGLILVLLVNLFCLKNRAATHHVSIIDSRYVPDQLAIGVGDTVIWTNDDNTEHTVTSLEDDGALFDSGSITPEDIFSREFDAAGSYPYYCTLHGRSLSGVIVVAEATENHPPATPENVLPAHNAGNLPVALQLRGTAFSDPDAVDFHGASEWLLRYASNGVVAVDSGIVTGGSLTNYSPAGLLEGTSYDWQVRYRDGRGLWSEFSTAARFTTLVPVGAHGIGLRAGYYNTLDSFAPLVVVTNATIDFNWGNVRPHRRITADNFAVRWEGSLLPQFTQLYQVQLQYRGRARVWVKNELLIDEWTGCGFTQTRRGAVSLVAGQLAPLRVEYVADPAGAAAILRWTASTSLALEVIPTARLFPPAE
jgi:plastocyanin